MVLTPGCGLTPAHQLTLTTLTCPLKPPSGRYCYLSHWNKISQTPSEDVRLYQMQLERVLCPDSEADVDDERDATVSI